MIEDGLKVGDLVEARSGDYSVCKKHEHYTDVIERTYLDREELGIVIEVYRIKFEYARVYLFGRGIEVWGQISPWRKIA